MQWKTLQRPKISLRIIALSSFPAEEDYFVKMDGYLQNWLETHFSGLGSFSPSCHSWYAWRSQECFSIFIIGHPILPTKNGSEKATPSILRLKRFAMKLCKCAKPFFVPTFVRQYLFIRLLTKGMTAAVIPAGFTSLLKPIVGQLLRLGITLRSLSESCWYPTSLNFSTITVDTPSSHCGHNIVTITSFSIRLHFQ